MAKITEQNIIDAIVALDVEKLKEIKESLVEAYNNDKKFIDGCCRKMRILEDAGFSECSEYKALYSEYENINTSSVQTINLIGKCTKALKVFNY